MQETASSRRLERIVSYSGYIALIASVIILVVGLILVQGAARDFKASVDVTQGAVTSIDETIQLVEGATQTLDDGIASATAAIEGVGDTATIGADGISGLADFLEEDLSGDIDSIRDAMPAAIQAAAAIDRTLRALSLIGVDYNPDQPFDESLTRFDEALADLPDGLREQSEVLRNLAPAASGLGQESERLAQALDQVGDDLDEIENITAAYSSTLEEASITLAQTSDSLDRNVWLVRLLIISIAVVGGAVGLGLVAAGRSMGAIVYVPASPKALAMTND